MVKVFINEIQDKQVVTSSGREVGTLDNFVIDTETGEIPHILVTPSERVDLRAYRTDAQGRIVLPGSAIRAVKGDVVVIHLPGSRPAPPTR